VWNDLANIPDDSKNKGIAGLFNNNVGGIHCNCVGCAPTEHHDANPDNPGAGHP